MCQKGDMEQVQFWVTTDIRRHHTKFSRHGDLAPRICAPMEHSLFIWHYKRYRRNDFIPGGSLNCAFMRIREKVSRYKILIRKVELNMGAAANSNYKSDTNSCS
jgi:hypothetical protein